MSRSRVVFGRQVVFDEFENVYYTTIFSFDYLATILGKFRRGVSTVFSTPCILGISTIIFRGELYSPSAHNDVVVLRMRCVNVCVFPCLHDSVHMPGCMGNHVTSKITMILFNRVVMVFHDWVNRILFSPIVGLYSLAIKRLRTRSVAVHHWCDLTLSAYERDLVTNEKI